MSIIPARTARRARSEEPDIDATRPPLDEARAELTRRVEAHARSVEAVQEARIRRQQAADAADQQRAIVARLEDERALADREAATPPEILARIADCRESIRLLRIERSALFARLQRARVAVGGEYARIEQLSLGGKRNVDDERLLAAAADITACERAIAGLDSGELSQLQRELDRLLAEQDEALRPPVERDTTPPVTRLIRDTLSGTRPRVARA